MGRRFEVATTLVVAGGLALHSLTMDVEIAILDPSGHVVRFRPEHVEERPLWGYESVLRNFQPTIAATGSYTPWAGNSFELPKEK